MKGQEVMKYLPFLTVICLGCFAAASAEAGAKLCGDVDGDQDVDITDAMLVAQYYNGMNPSGFNADVADVDGSGDITIVDALLMAQYYVGLIDRFPAVDLSTLQYFPPIGRQAPYGTCTAWASAYYYGTFLAARDNDWDASGGDHTVLNSIHYLFREYSQGYTGAECTETAMATLSQIGCASEASYPSWEYDANGNLMLDENGNGIPLSFAEDPSPAAVQEALLRRPGQLNKIEFPLDYNESQSEIALEAMKQVLARNQPLVTRAYFRDNYWSYPYGESTDENSGVMYANYEAPPVDFYRHTLAIVGYNDNKSYMVGSTEKFGAFLVANSEGPNWGVYNTSGASRGFLWVAYDMFVNHEIGRYDEVDSDPVPRDPCYDNVDVPTVYFHGAPVVGSEVVDP